MVLKAGQLTKDVLRGGNSSSREAYALPGDDGSQLPGRPAFVRCGHADAPGDDAPMVGEAPQAIRDICF